MHSNSINDKNLTIFIMVIKLDLYLNNRSGISLNRK